MTVRDIKTCDEVATPGQYPAWRDLVDRFYPSGHPARDILLQHSRAVADLALELNRRAATQLDPEQVEYAAMTHDIGIAMTHAPGIGCNGTEPYIRHGILGADLLRRNCAPEWAARVAERHTGTGLTADEISAEKLPLPADRDLMPRTPLERLICYADKFYSKRPGQLTQRKTVDVVRAELAAHGAATLDRFDAMTADYSRPRT